MSEMNGSAMALETFRDFARDFAQIVGFGADAVEEMSSEEGGVTPEVFKAYTACLREFLDDADQDFQVVKEFLTT